STPVTAGVIAGPERGEEASGERLVDCRVPSRLHLLHDLRADQDVALDRDAVAGDPTRPVEAVRPRVGSRSAVDVDQADLAVLALVVLLQQPLEGYSRGRALIHVG